MKKTVQHLLMVALLVSVFPATRLTSEKKFQIMAISSRPDMVSGGNVLVQIDVPRDVPLNRPKVTLNGKNVISVFHPDAGTHTLTGLVTGLTPGENLLEIFPDAKGRGRTADQLKLMNHTITGPVFSGPQEQPFLCQTQDFRLPDGTSLGQPIDSDCSVKTVVTYVYRSSAPTEAASGPRSRGALFKPLPSLGTRPSDIAWTTTTDGTKVPYVVRVETGTINRGIYQIAVLHDPTAESTPGPLSPPKAWNKRLLYSFGPGCIGGWFKQGTSIGYGSVLNDAIVGKGYAEAASTLNVFSNNCNDVIAAETMMMVKERFIKDYGKPLFTFSRGTSGGSYQQVQIADDYPGLLDGIVPSSTFPDILETVQQVSDAQLLENYYKKAGEALTDEQKRSISGMLQLQNVSYSGAQASRINPSLNCPTDLAQSQRYNPVTSRSGARCDVFDHAVNVYGRDPATGFARRPMDNIGVQYGLAALNAGVITPSQFLDLNQNIGSHDNDGNIVETRSLADPLVLRKAYQSGRVSNGGKGLANVPIIDVRPFRDRTPTGEFHQKYHSFSLRDRLSKANGTTANEVLLVGPLSLSGQMDEFALAKMDEWLTKLVSDPSGDRMLDKIARARPADLADSCYTSNGERLIEPQTFSGEGQCNSLYPTSLSPRMVAGGPASNDVLKCQLKPIDAGDYKVAFSDAEKARLRAIFPNGVCDWGKAGVEQQGPAGTWLTY